MGLLFLSLLGNWFELVRELFSGLVMELIWNWRGSSFGASSPDDKTGNLCKRDSFGVYVKKPRQDGVYTKRTDQSIRVGGQITQNNRANRIHQQTNAVLNPRVSTPTMVYTKNPMNGPPLLVYT